MEIQQNNYNMNNPFSLLNKTILVTGASSGLGKRIAIRCSESGANMIISGRNEHRMGETFLQLSKDGNHSKIACDLAVRDNIRAFVESLPVLDGIVMDAAIFDTTIVRHLKEEKMDALFSTNTFANILLMQTLLKKKKIRNGGSVVFISSVASTRPYKGNALYSATKGAINSFAKVTALELATQKIRVNCIHPGIISSGNAVEKTISLEDLKKENDRIPLGFGKADDIAYAAVYLLSDVAGWITGSDLIVDGGQSII